MTLLDVAARLAQGRFRLDAKFVAPGDGITALFGPSGSGKSTLLSVLAGLKRCDGYVRLGARALADSGSHLHLAPHRRGIGVVFQDARLFPHLTARANIAYAWKRAPEKARPDICDVARFFDITAQLDRPVGNLSGGEKSRVALARAVAGAPDFLLLDEPFAALDGARRRAFIQVLLAMHETYRLPMMVVTHDIDDAAMLASHLVALNEGRVVAFGPFADVSLQPEFRRLLDDRDAGVAMPARHLRTVRGGQSLWLRADQVLLATERPRAISARNVLQGEVRAVTAEASGGMLIELSTPEGIILSRVTPDAVADLGLVAGCKAWALIKAHPL